MTHYFKQNHFDYQFDDEPLNLQNKVAMSSNGVSFAGKQPSDKMIQNIKIEEDQNRGGKGKRKGRPKKNPDISSQSQTVEKKVKDKMTDLSKSKKQLKLEQMDGSPSEENRSKKIKLQPFNPDQSDLCEALLILKNKLPNRSLQKIIVKLFETIQQEKNKPSSFSLYPSDGKKAHSQISHFSEKEVSQRDKDEKISQHVNQTDYKADKNIAKEVKIQNDVDSLQREKKQQIYTNRTSHSKLNASESNDQDAPARFNQTNVIMHFKESDKQTFYNQSEEERFHRRRQLAKIFIERGYGVTKKIDNQLPRINLARDTYKTLMASVLTAAFRRLESFLINQCQRTITTLERPQMKAIIFTLLHCKVKLEPTSYDVFLKFLKISYSLGDVSVSQEQAVELYIGILRHLYGKNTTMEICQNKWRIKNMRVNDKTHHNSKERAQDEQNHSQKDPNNPSGQKSLSLFGTESVNNTKRKLILFQDQSMGNQLHNEQLWTQQSEVTFINLYIKFKNLNKVQAKIHNKHPQLRILKMGSISAKLIELVQRGLNKMEKDSDILSPKGILLGKAKYNWLQSIKTSQYESQICIIILKYLYSKDKSTLTKSICQINSFLQENFAGQIQSNGDYYFDQDQEEQIGNIQQKQDGLNLGTKNLASNLSLFYIQKRQFKDK